MYVLCTRAKDIRQLFNRLEDIRNKISQDADNRTILLNAEKLGKKLVIYFTAYELIAPILLLIFKTIHEYFTDFETRRFLTQICIPWNTDEIWAYLLANVFVNVMAFTCCMALVMFAGVELSFTFQTSACLKILQNYFENRGPADQVVYQYHDTLIQIINDYNYIFSETMFVETLFAPLMPCGYSMTLIRSLRKKRFNQLAPGIVKVFGCMFPFIITLSCGQEVNTQVERLHESSYTSNWYEETPKVRRDLLTLMIRTTKPTTVNYRLFIKFNRECLASVLQGLYSFLMLVINFDTDS
ncbi:hypothetical protein O3M35_009743 [Rhynocoris fuscipes]|uniref:Odorant receptor n=1 Tax=Rhynocoris fuscipes TaxID=488301 RepID=A0AAW1D417_9HEMI